jgi:hypothetical protein
VRETAGRLYAQLSAAGIDVLLDDRDERPGVMFADMELIGIPHHVVIGERGLKDGRLEYKGPSRQRAQMMPPLDIGALPWVKARLCAASSAPALRRSACSRVGTRSGRGAEIRAAVGQRAGGAFCSKQYRFRDQAPPREFVPTRSRPSTG